MLIKRTGSALLLMAAATLAACSGGGDDQAEPSPAPSPTEEATTTAPPSDPGTTTAPADPIEPARVTGPLAITGPVDPAVLDPATLPGVPVGDAELQISEGGLGWYELAIGEGELAWTEEASRPAVHVNYEGWVLDGSATPEHPKFDSSIDRGEPACYLLSDLVPGWKEGVGEMRVGGKRKLIIPGQLGYGPGGNPAARIPASAMIVFDVELIGVDPFTGDPDVWPGNEVTGEMVAVADDGLRYTITTAGDGAVTDGTQSMRARFTMYLTDGTEVLSSGDNALDITDRTFPGMTNAVVGIRVGESRKVIIPHMYTPYGERGQPPSIPPKATLVLDLELEELDPWLVLPDPPPGEPVAGDPVATDTSVTYYVLEAGGEETVSSERAQVTMECKAYYVDGTPFIDTDQSGEPMVMDLRSPHVNGLAEGLVGIAVGERRKVIIPPDRAFGLYGRGQSIPPNATLIFDVKLLEREMFD